MWDDELRQDKFAKCRIQLWPENKGQIPSGQSGAGHKSCKLEKNDIWCFKKPGGTFQKRDTCLEATLQCWRHYQIGEV